MFDVVFRRLKCRRETPAFARRARFIKVTTVETACDTLDNLVSRELDRVRHLELIGWLGLRLVFYNLQDRRKQ